MKQLIYIPVATTQRAYCTEEGLPVVPATEAHDGFTEDEHRLYLLEYGYGFKEDLMSRALCRLKEISEAAKEVRGD